MAEKSVGIEIDYQELNKQIEERRQEELKSSQSVVRPRTTVFSSGQSPQLGLKPRPTVPDLYRGELLRDGLDNPFVKIYWRIPRADVDSAGVVGFEIFRKKLSAEEFLMKNTRNFNVLQRFSSLSVDRVARKIPQFGKFSADKKAIYQIDADLMPLISLHPNLALSHVESSKKMQDFLSPNLFYRSAYSDSATKAVLQEKQKLLDNLGFYKIGFVSYEQFLKKEKDKSVLVTERNLVTLDYQDKTVVYGKAYEYYVVPVSENLLKILKSESVRVYVEDQTHIRPPKQIKVKQINSTEVRVSICLHPSDHVSRVLVFKRSENDLRFRRLGILTNVSDCINFLDSDVVYNKKYTYRIFAEDTFGVLSEPSEITFYSSDQKTTSSSRSNVLKVPVLDALPDQNSDGIKIVIGVNDPFVSYYVLDRRDLSIHERKFSVPSKESTNYGGNGWKSNKFFVDKNKAAIVSDLKSPSDVLNKQNILQQIEFIDNTTQKGHVYQYRIVGQDLFGNKGSYALKTVKASGKKEIRAPVNLRYEVLRGNPFRAKLLWDDDNLSNLFDFDEVFKVNGELNDNFVKMSYRIQRRRQGEFQYVSFPLTANNFLIDESPSDDNIVFSAKKTNDVYSPLEDREVGNLNTTNLSNIRPFKFPSYLNLYDVYFFRVAAVDQYGNESNFTSEIRVDAFPSLSNPSNLRAEALNLKVKPLIARLSWENEIAKSPPDHWIIQRKTDSQNDTFEVIGRAYIDTVFFDRSLESGKSYIYRVRSVDNLGRKSDFFEARLTT